VPDVIDFLIRPCIQRRAYWISLPILGLIAAGGWLLFRWSYAHGDIAPLRVSGMAITLVAIALALWVVGRRMKDTSPRWILWFLGMWAGARLAEMLVRRAGGSWEQGQAAFGLAIVLVLFALGLVPSWSPPAPDLGEEALEDEEVEDESAEEIGVTP
jgi:hypothetical protein